MTYVDDSSTATQNALLTCVAGRGGGGTSHVVTSATSATCLAMTLGEAAEETNRTLNVDVAVFLAFEGRILLEEHHIFD